MQIYPFFKYCGSRINARQGAAELIDHGHLESDGVLCSHFLQWRVNVD